MKHQVGAARLEVGEDHVRVVRRGDSGATVAAVLDLRLDDQGRVRWAVLDRRIHRSDERELGAFRVWGAITTEIVRKDA